MFPPRELDEVLVGVMDGEFVGVLSGISVAGLIEVLAGVLVGILVGGLEEPDPEHPVTKSKQTKSHPQFLIIE